MINLFLVDDHEYLIQGLIAALEHHEFEANIVGSATSGKEAINLLSSLYVDVVLLDIIMPEMDGIECCRQIKKDFPHIKVIALTGELNPDILLNIWLEKADGILTKTGGVDELVGTIKSVMKGQKVIGNDVPGFFEYSESPTNHVPKLTITEREVLKLLGSGLTRQEAADKMNKTKYSVEFHCKNLFRKFNTNRIHSIIAEARKARLIK